MKNSKNDFNIKLVDIFWLEESGSMKDLCAHGHINFRIGDNVLCDMDNGSFTVSSTALYLLRTLQSDHFIGDWASQFIPCCGHSFFVQDDKVILLGCCNGIDFRLIHKASDIEINYNGLKGVVTTGEYKDMVSNFVQKVEDFYESSDEKIVPKDYEKGYKRFWDEWSELKLLLKS